MDEEETITRVKGLIEKIGGAPPGVKSIRDYAVVSEIYDTGMSLNKAESIVKYEQRIKNSQNWQRMMAQRKANEEAEEEAYRKNPFKDEEEAKLRREKTMKKIYSSIEERRSLSKESI